MFVEESLSTSGDDVGRKEIFLVFIFLFFVSVNSRMHLYKIFQDTVSQVSHLKKIKLNLLSNLIYNLTSNDSKMSDKNV